MDVLDRIGEGHLERKASATPQQLENHAPKQIKESTNLEKQAKRASKVPSEEKDQEIARLRKELALLKVGKGERVAEPKETKQGHILGRWRSADQQPKVKKAERENAVVEELTRRQSADQNELGSASSTTVITVDQGRRRRSSVHTPTGRSSTDSIERRREPRYHSPRTSRDLGKRDFHVVQVTEPLPRARKGSKEVTRFREVTVSQKETCYTAVH